MSTSSSRSTTFRWSRTPNPRLQRTPLRAPLSRKPLGRAGQVSGPGSRRIASSGCSAILAATEPSPALPARPRRLLAR